MHTNIHRGIVFCLILLLVYSRFVNLGWGLPYPMHPDERNMADAMMKIQCDNPSEFVRGLLTLAPRNVYTYLTIGEYALPGTKVDCLNPHFFAYGQLSLYSASMIARFVHTLSQGTQEMRIQKDFNFSEAVMGLRLLSAIASCLTVFILLKILQLLNRRFSTPVWKYVALLFCIFSPILIQFSHFGTTEAALVLWFSFLVYGAIQAVQRKKLLVRDIVFMSIVCGLAIATKVSSLLFLFIPWMVILVKTYSYLWMSTSNLLKSDVIARSPFTGGMTKQSHYLTTVFYSWILSTFSLCISILFTTIVAGLVSVIFSPHNVISLRELLGSMHYESDVGLGRYIAFYTRQFLVEAPLFFQFQHILPYALGVVTFVLSAIGFLFLPWKKSYTMVRFAIVVYSALTMGWYTKWTRFLAPVYPLLTIFAVCGLYLILQKVRKKYRSRRITSLVGIVLTLICISPGIAFISIYANRDVRFVASEWIYNNIPAKSYVLSETANVIDVPIPDVRNNGKIPDGFNFQYLSFNSYEVDADRELQKSMQDAIAQADYIFVPSRRVYYNHTCVGLDGKVTTLRHSKAKCEYLARTYPVLKKYYEDLFSGRLGFVKVAEFSAYPRIQLFGKTILEFPDESAEETFTVFDHPVMRVYKRQSGVQVVR